jgi:hypothetical protein
MVAGAHWIAQRPKGPKERCKHGHTNELERKLLSKIQLKSYL